MWADFLIQRDMETLEWDNKGIPKYGIEFHGKQQIAGWKLKKNRFSRRGKI